nr:hypothetical protein [Tanacetum cinerariifolium]
MTKSNKKKYIADVKVMNYLLQAIPNDIYNSVDACKNAKEIEQMLLAMKDESGSNLNDEENDFMLDKSFGNETLEELTTIVIMMAQIQPANDNSVKKPNYDAKAVCELYDSLVQFEPHIQASKAKRAAKNHDPLALIAHSNASLSQSHASPSYSHSPQPYYVTHPSSVVNYEENYQGELQGDSQEDKLTTEMMLLARSITQKFSTPTNNRLCTSSNTRNQAVIQDAMKDESGSNLNDEENDFMLDKSFGNETLEELTTIVIMMAQIQPANDNSVKKPNYDAKAVCVESSNSVRRPQSKDTKSKNRVLKNTNVKSSFAHVQKVSISVSIDSNKHETMNLIACQSKESVLNTKTVNVDRDGSNIFCVSCGKNVFMLSHEKCVARYTFSRDSRVKRALFTTPVSAKSWNLGATFVVTKSRFSVAKTPVATNKLVLWIVDSGYSKHMANNLKLLRIFVEKFMGTVRFGNDHFATITGYGDYVQGNLTICHVYYVEGLGHNLFLVGQFYDGDLEVSFRSNTCYVRNLEGDDLLTGSRESNIYIIFISELTDSSPLCLMVCFLHTKDEAPDMIINFINQVQQNLKAQILKIRTDNRTEFKNEKLRNHTLVEVAHTMLIFSKTLEFLWAEAISTACFTQMRSIVRARYNKTPYELIRGTKPNVQYFYVFRSLCYPTNNRDDLRKMKPKADISIFIGYSESSRGFRLYNRRTKKIMEMVHVKFDELTAMASKCNNPGFGLNCSNFQDSSDEINEILSHQDLDNLFGPLYEKYYAPSTFEVSNNTATNTLDVEDTPSLSLIIVEDSDAS